MTVWIALLRGINVGGRHRLPMKDLTAQIEALGGAEVKTYIQSGNAVFRAAAGKGGPLAERIGEGIERTYGFRPKILALSLSDYEKIAAANPYPQADADPKAVHVYFLAAKPKTPDLEGLGALASKRERFELKKGAFYLYAPDGIGRSKLAERVEKLLGVEATARNWRSVAEILKLAQTL